MLLLIQPHHVHGGSSCIHKPLFSYLLFPAEIVPAMTQAAHLNKMLTLFRVIPALLQTPFKNLTVSVAINVFALRGASELLAQP